MARRILQSIQLDKIAAVDRPCQEGATVAILKRAPEAEVIEKSEDDTRLIALQQKVLLAKTGMAMLSAFIVKEFDESKHPRAEDGRFGTGGGSSSEGSKDTGSSKEVGGSKPKHRVLRALKFLTGVGEIVLAANVAHAALGVATIFNAMGGVALLAAPVVAAGFVGAALPVVLGIAGLEIIRRSLGAIINKASPKLPKDLQLRIKSLSPEQAKKFVDNVMNSLSDEQASKVAAKLEDIATKVKEAKSKSDVKKMWSEAARAAATEARSRAGHHRASAQEHNTAGRTHLGMKHDMVADHYEEAATHYEAGRKDRGDAVRGNGEAILSWNRYGHSVKKSRVSRPMPPDKNNGSRRGKQSPKKSDSLIVSPGSPGSIFGVNKILEAVTKSAIALSVLPDPIAHVRKVIGDTAADYIKDFVNSDNPKFKGKSKQERIKQALGAYYGSR